MKAYEKDFLQIYVDDDRACRAHDWHCKRAGGQAQMGEQEKEQV